MKSRITVKHVTVGRICAIGMAVDSMLWHLEYVNSRKWSRSRSSVEVASHKLDQLIYWVVNQLMELKESTKERGNEGAIAIGSKWNSGRCGNGGLVG